MATIREYLDKMSTGQLLQLIRMNALGQFTLDPATLLLICEMIANRENTRLE